MFDLFQMMQNRKGFFFGFFLSQYVFNNHIAKIVIIKIIITIIIIIIIINYLAAVGIIVNFWFWIKA